MYETDSVKLFSIWPTHEQGATAPGWCTNMHVRLVWECSRPMVWLIAAVLTGEHLSRLDVSKAACDLSTLQGQVT